MTTNLVGASEKSYVLSFFMLVIALIVFLVGFSCILETVIALPYVAPKCMAVRNSNSYPVIAENQTVTINPVHSMVESFTPVYNPSDNVQANVTFNAVTFPSITVESDSQSDPAISSPADSSAEVTSAMENNVTQTTTTSIESQPTSASSYASAGVNLVRISPLSSTSDPAVTVESEIQFSVTSSPPDSTAAAISGIENNITQTTTTAESQPTSASNDVSSGANLTLADATLSLTNVDTEIITSTESNTQATTTTESQPSATSDVSGNVSPDANLTISSSAVVAVSGLNVDVIAQEMQVKQDILDAVPQQCLLNNTPLGKPSDDNSIRIFSQDECENTIIGNYYADGECLKKEGGSWSWDCRLLNPFNFIPLIGDAPCYNLGTIDPTRGNMCYYTWDECMSMGGNFYPDGECLIRTGGSFTWNCRQQ